MRALLRQLRPAALTVAVFTVLLGLAYPLVVTAVSQLAFDERADGSLIRRHGEIVGSTLIGQAFIDPRYFHGRPSAAGDGYDGAASSGSNLGPHSEDLLADVEARAAAYRRENGLPAGADVPVDAVTASGSGLDPHISVTNARLQAPRVAAARGLALSDVEAMIDEHTTARTFGVLGEDGVDVVMLNLALDEAAS